MLEDIEKNIVNGKYDEAEKLLLVDMDFEQVKNKLLALAYDGCSVCVYSFVRYMFEKKHDLHWLSLACSLMVGPFCSIEGAYSTGLFHARQMLEEEYSVSNLEMILFFYETPEKLIEKEEAVSIANQILKLDPNNEFAKKILE